MPVWYLMLPGVILSSLGAVVANVQTIGCPWTTNLVLRAALRVEVANRGLDGEEGNGACVLAFLFLLQNDPQSFLFCSKGSPHTKMDIIATLFKHRQTEATFRTMVFLRPPLSEQQLTDQPPTAAETPWLMRHEPPLPCTTTDSATSCACNCSGAAPNTENQQI